MREIPFDMENIKFGNKKNRIVLLQGREDLFLSLKDINNQEISKIKVLQISKEKNVKKEVKKITNFFIRGFNMPLEGKRAEDMLIPEEQLMEAERKIIVIGEDSKKKVKEAIDMLEKNFEGEINRKDYERTMVYLDTPNKQLKDNNMIFRLTQENNDVKATIHMDNNLSGDQKHIIKFFFTDTSMSQVVNFFREAISLTPITRSILSKRLEYKSSVGEVAIDSVDDEENHVYYYSIELELDQFVDQNRDSARIDEKAQEIASKLGLEGYEIVDLGTEAIYNKISGKDFFEVNKENQ